MKPGKSEIFVYNYEGMAPSTKIGRVYVEDPDDWDLPDKTFKFANPNKWRRKFALDSNTGAITMLANIALPEEINTFTLDFIVEDPTFQQVGKQAVQATVNVTIQRISKEAVIKSGSIRIKGKPEDFIRADIITGVSKRDELKESLSMLLNNGSIVEIFTVLPKGIPVAFTDVRFSAHGSPYFAPEKLEGVLIKHRETIEKNIDREIVMIHIDECLVEGEKGPCPWKSCANNLNIQNELVTISTNKTTFVGVNANVEASCKCKATRNEYYHSCTPNPCLNNGTCQLLPSGGYTCNCPADNPEYFGPYCERLAASFNGQGWSLHKGIESCDESQFTMTFNTAFEDGTLLYTGPSPNNIIDNVSDFFSIELKKGKLAMKINFGSVTKFLNLDQRVDDSRDHYLVVHWTNDTVQMTLDDKSCSNEITTSTHQKCFTQITTHDLTHHYINTNGPLHVGGVPFKFDDLASRLGKNR